MPKKPEISVIICTHNRAEQLNQSLSHYTELEDAMDYELIIVLNDCTDHSVKVVKDWIHKGLIIKQLIEPDKGLSKARNSGWKAAEADWVFYIDDDAYPAPDLLIKLRGAIHNNNDAIGGRTIHWRDNASAWILDEFVETPVFITSAAFLPENAYLSGCAMGFKKATLKELGGFRETFGMVGGKLAYAEEIDVQDRLLKNNHKIWYDPNIEVYHKSHLQNVRSFLQANYQKGAYLSKLRTRNIKFNILMLIKSAIMAPIVGITYSAQHHYKSGVVKALKPFMYHLGRIIG
ncbi:MAG: glycosyltransferase [Bacteroidia bacterium]